MRKKLFALLIAAIAAALLLTACAGDNLEKTEEHVHTFGEWTVVTPATCEAEGTEKRVCSECEKEETRTIEKLPHTCQWETDGTTLRGKCEICGEAVIKEDTLTYELNAEETEYCVSGVREGTAPTDVIIPVKNNEKPITSIGDEAFRGCDSLVSVAIPNSVTSIGDDAFRECGSLIDITIPNSVTSIGDNAFVGCGSLKSVVIGNGVTSIGESAFSVCNSLETLTVAEGNPKYCSAGNCVIETETKTLIIGCKTSVIPTDESVTSIGYGAFCGSSLVSVVIPNSVTSIDIAFSLCGSLETLTVAEGNAKYFSAGNCVIERETKTLIAGCKNSIIPTDGSVTSIGYGAFYGCGSLKSVEIPASVTSIGSEAFSSCNSLETLTVAEGNANYYSVENCLIETETKTLILGCKNSIIPTDGSVTSIGFRAFRGCGSLVSINIPDSVTSIDSGAFEDTGIWNNAADNSVVYADKWAVGYKGDENSVTEITLREDTVGIGDDAFFSCGSLKSVEIPNSVTSVGDYAFAYCGSLESVVIGNGVTSIGSNAFSDCRSLKSVVIGNSVTSIGFQAFDACFSLTNVEYKGTKAEWKAIKKGSNWNSSTGDYTVKCTDGTLTKAESES